MKATFRRMLAWALVVVLAVSSLGIMPAYAEELSFGSATLQSSDTARVSALAASDDIPYTAFADQVEAGSITLDGSLDEAVWDTLECAVDKHAEPSPPSNQCHFTTAWDDEYFYVAVEVRDSIVCEEISGEIYQNDAVEIFIDPNADGTYDDKTVHFMIQGYDGKTGIMGGSTTWGTPVGYENYEIQRVLTATGYTVELKVPFSELGISPEAGAYMQLAVCNKDKDDGAQSSTEEITWMDGFNSGEADTWGYVYLSSAGKQMVSYPGTAAVDGSATESYEWTDATQSWADYTAKIGTMCDTNNLYLAYEFTTKDGGNIDDVLNDQHSIEVFLSGDNDQLENGRSPEGHDLDISLFLNKPSAPQNYIRTCTGGDLDAGQEPSYSYNPAGVKFEIASDGSKKTVEISVAWDLLKPDRDYLTTVGLETIFNLPNAYYKWSGAESPYNASLGYGDIVLNSQSVAPPPNQAPSAPNQINSYSIAQGQSISGTINVTDPEGDPLTYAVEQRDNTAAASEGTFTLNEKTGAWTYTTPDANFTATSVNYFVRTSDDHGGSFLSRVEIRVEHTPTYLTYHVDGDTGSDSNTGLSADQAFKTIQKAHSVTNPGDTVLIHASEIPYGYEEGVITLTRSGLPEAYITYKAAEGERPVINSNGKWNTIVVRGSYIKLEDLDVEGIADHVSYDDAWAIFYGKSVEPGEPGYIEGYGDNISMGNTNGINISPESDLNDAERILVPHHVEVRNCVFNMLSAGSLGTSQSDYIIFENNTVTNNCWWDMYACSGIGTLGNRDIDGNTTTPKIIIRNNITAGNRHFIPWSQLNPVRLSDGNGIIIDSNNNESYNEESYEGILPYAGRTLVANNLSYNNGGSGIHVFDSNHVDMINNTVYNANACTGLNYSDFYASDADDINMYNNIVYSRTGNKMNITTASNTNVSYDNNLFYNYDPDNNNLGVAYRGTTPGQNNIYGEDPLFVNRPEIPNDANVDAYPDDWSDAKKSNAEKARYNTERDYDINQYEFDFTLSAGSPALNAGNQDWSEKVGNDSNNLGIFGTVGADRAVQKTTELPSYPTAAPVPGDDDDEEEEPTVRPAGPSTAFAEPVADGTITLDGKLDEEIWTNLPYQVDQLTESTTPNNTYNFGVFWDSENFYVGVSVKDDKIVAVEGAEVYENDAIEIFINPSNNLESFDDRTAHFMIQAADGTVKIMGGPSAWDWITDTAYLNSEMQCATVDGGYTVELKIPFADMGYTAEEVESGLHFGFAVCGKDNDSNVKGAEELTWVKGSDAGKPSTWGAAYLSAGEKEIISYPKTVKVDGILDEGYAFAKKNAGAFTAKVGSFSDSEFLYLGYEIAMADSNGNMAEALADNAGIQIFLSGHNDQLPDRKSPLGHDIELVLKAKENTINYLRSVDADPATPSADYNYGFEGMDDVSVVMRDEGNKKFIEVAIPLDCLNPDRAYLSTVGLETIFDMLGTYSTWANSPSPWRCTEGYGAIVLNNVDVAAPANQAPSAPNQINSYSIPQGGSVSGTINVTDPEGDPLTYRLDAPYADEADGTFTLDEETGAWSYQTPNDTFMKESINYFVITSDDQGREFRSRIEIRVEHAPTNLTWHVDGDTGSDTNDGRTPETAFKTIMKAHDVSNPGDTILIYDSEVPYGWSDTEYYHDGQTVLTRSGLPDAYITYKAAPGHHPVIKSNGEWNTIMVCGSYLKLEGLTIEGIADQVDYETGWKVYRGYLFKDDPDHPEGNPSVEQDCSISNTNGINVGPYRTIGKESTTPGVMVTLDNVLVTHHVEIRNCVVDKVTAGNGASNCDYILFENNTFTNNGWYDMWASSGLGVLNPIAIDGETDAHKIIFRNNIVAGNRHFIPWVSLNPPRLSDGNGIIVDSTNNQTLSSSQKAAGYKWGILPYNARILVANNLSYFNGGSGMHVFASDHVDLVNNTVYDSVACEGLGYSTFYASEANDVNMFNNIVYTRDNGKMNISTASNQGVAYDNNLFYNYDPNNNNLGEELAGTVPGANNIYGEDPLFVNRPIMDNSVNAANYPSTWTEEMKENALKAHFDPTRNYDIWQYEADFSLAENSPAWGKADASWQAIAGGAEYPNAIGIFGTVGAVQDAEQPEEADKTQLERAIETAEAKNESRYTASSWAAMEKALEHATSVYADGTATQAEVDEAVEALEKALDGLVKRSSNPGVPVLPVLPGGDDDEEDVYDFFDDVPKRHWAYEAVTYVADSGLFNGVDEGTFGPDLQMNRAMLVTVLWRMAGEPAQQYSGTFADVPAGTWYTEAVEWAAANGIVNGTGSGFAPMDPVTREQIAAILWRMEGEPAADAAELDIFTDGVEVSSYAKEAMAWAVSEGLFQGTNGKVNPRNLATRAEVATLIYRYVNFVQE